MVEMGKGIMGDKFQKEVAKRLLKNRDSGGGSEEKDPLKEAADFTKQMAANAIVEGQVAKVKAEAAKAQAEAREADAKARRAETGGVESGSAGIQVRGKFDYGDVNLQAEREEFKKDSEKREQSMAQKIDQLEKGKKEAEEKVQQIGMAALSKEIETLRSDIKTGLSQKDFADQYEELIGKAKRLGLMKPEGETGDPSLRLQILKLEHDEAAREREFQRQLKREAKEEKKEDRKYAEEQAFRDAQLAEERKKNEMFAKTPAILGQFISQGLINSKGGVGGQPQVEAPAFRLKAGIGELGETDCPQCKKPIAIGPTATKAVCAVCGAQYPIDRFERESAASAPSEVVKPSPEDEE